MSIKINPVGNKIIIKPKEFSNIKSGLTLPKTEDKRRPEQGVIIAISKHIPKEDIDFKVGDLVLFDKYMGDVYELQEQQYMILDYTNIHAVVK